MKEIKGMKSIKSTNYWTFCVKKQKNSWLFQSGTARGFIAWPIQCIYSEMFFVLFNFQI